MLIRLSNTFRVNFFEHLLHKPFLILVFFYFVTLSGDLLHIRFFLFTAKLTNIVGIATFSCYLLLYKSSLNLSRDILLATCACLISLIFSAILGYNQIACIGFILFFVFNYFIYFVFPSSLFFIFDKELILRIYFTSFICVGTYATAQVLFSFFGIRLPFSLETIADRITRGQGFSYEPSYYALYMTPYTVFQTTRYLLQSPKERSTKDLILANFFLIISTSSGCLFTYLALIACLGLFKFIKILRQLSARKLLFKFIMYGWVCSLLLSLINPSLISEAFFKFFCTGFMTHYSFSERWNMLWEYWTVFLDNFWTGTGLGGATTFLLYKRGIESADIFDPEILRSPSLIATNVTTEVLASLGIFGALCFGYFFWIILKKFKAAYKIPNLEREDNIELTAFAISLCVTFFTLQFSQSIMRCYIWAHTGIIIGYIKYLQMKYRPSQAKKGT